LTKTDLNDPLSRTIAPVLALSFTSLLCWYDRAIFPVLIIPLQRELEITDVQAGYLLGFAYVILSAVAVIPLCRLGDRTSHFGLLRASIVFWSVATAACGWASGFLSLALGRMGVGLGEVAAQPVTHALVSGLYPAEKRSRILSIVAVGTNLGMLLGAAVGALMAQRIGWRPVFWIAGAVGLVFSAVFGLLVPKTQSMRVIAQQPVAAWQAIAKLISRRSYRFLLIGMTMSLICFSALQGWLPTFFHRRFGLALDRSSAYFAAFFVAPSLAGVVAGGFVSDWLLRFDGRAPGWMLILCYGGATPFLAILLLVHDLGIAMAASVVGGFVMSMAVGPFYGLMQSLADPESRATSTGIFVLVASSIGGMTGPALVGILSRDLAGTVGQNSLGIAIAFVLVFYLMSVPVHLAMIKSLVADISDTGLRWVKYRGFQDL
jgi:MFS family permease